MKEYVAFLLIAALAAAFCGCVAEEPPALSVAPAESEASSLEESTLPEENVSAESVPEESSLEESIPQETDPLQNGYILNQIRGQVLIMAYWDEQVDFIARYYARGEDGSFRQFHTEDDFIDGYMDLYEDRVVFNDFSWEVISTVYLYDIGTDEKKQLDISGLPEYETVSAMKWLDRRYFLFVSQFDHGTVVRGGDVWVYDTETDEYFRIIAREDGRLQIHDIVVYDGMILLDVPYYDEGFTETEQHYYTVATETIYGLIENRTETTLRVGEWLY